MYKEAISPALVRRAIRNRQIRALLASGISKAKKIPKTDNMRSDFVLRNSRVPLIEQLLNAVRKNAPSVSKVRGTADTANDVAKAFVQSANRTQPSSPWKGIVSTLVSKDKKSKASLLARLRQAGKQFREADNGRVDGVIAAIKGRTGTDLDKKSLLERLRVAKLRSRGNMYLRKVEVTDPVTGAKKIVPDKSSFLKRESSVSPYAGSVFKSRDGASVGFGPSDNPLQAYISSLSTGEFGDLSSPLKLQRVRGGLESKDYVEKLKKEINSRKNRKKYKNNWENIARVAVNSAPRSLTKTTDMLSRLSSGRSVLPRLSSFTTMPGHNQVRHLYEIGGFKPLADGNMVMSGGRLTPLRQLMLAKKSMQGTPEELLNYLNIRPKDVSTLAMIRNPKKYMDTYRNLIKDKTRITNKATRAEVFDEVRDRFSGPARLDTSNIDYDRAGGLRALVARNDRLMRARAKLKKKRTIFSLDPSASKSLTEARMVNEGLMHSPRVGLSDILYSPKFREQSANNLSKALDMAKDRIKMPAFMEGLATT